MSSEKLCYLMHLQLETFRVQNLNFTRKLLPVAWRSKIIYIFLGKWALLVSAKHIKLGFHWILALETTAFSIRGAASSKTCCDKCRVQEREHCGATCIACSWMLVGSCAITHRVGGIHVVLHVLPLERQENIFFVFYYPSRNFHILSVSLITLSVNI